LVSGRVLVTGGAGFIGSHLVDRLLSIKEVNEVTVLDDLSSGKVENLTASMKDKRLRLIRGDVRSEELVEELVKNVDYIFHEAAIVNVELSLKRPREVNSVNVGGTLNILWAALNNERIKRIVYASSCAVYGDPERMPIDEECRTRPISPYGVSKLAAELYMEAFYKDYGLPTVSLRYFNVYGPRQEASPYSGVISIFMYKALRGEPLTIFGDGEQTRDFVFVGDVVEANILAATNERAIGEVFNIGSGTEITIKELAKKIVKVSGNRNVRIVYAPPRKGDIKRSLANIEKAERVLGYTPHINMEKNLMKVLDYMKKLEDYREVNH